MKKKHKQGGWIIKWIIIIIALIALASYFFDFSVQDIIENQQTQDNFSYIWTHLVDFYNLYLKNIINYVWTHFVSTLFHS